MPRYDGTGPCGQGPMTGRGLGFCVMRVNENQPQADSPSRSAMAQHGPPAVDNSLLDLKGFAGIQGKIMSENPPQADSPSRSAMAQHDLPVA